MNIEEPASLEPVETASPARPDAPHLAAGGEANPADLRAPSPRVKRHRAWCVDHQREFHCAPSARAAIRSALFDAAHLCDIIADDIRDENPRGKRGHELAAIAKRCGDALWAMRDDYAEPAREPRRGGPR
jgi:hypothetical protein